MPSSAIHGHTQKPATNTLSSPNIGKHTADGELWLHNRIYCLIPDYVSVCVSVFYRASNRSEIALLSSVMQMFCFRYLAPLLCYLSAILLLMFIRRLHSPAELKIIFCMCGWLASAVRVATIAR